MRFDVGMAHHPEELPVYQAAVKLAEAVNAMLTRPALCRNRKLHDQISDANDSIRSNIAEGFEQQSDVAFSRYLYISKGSAAEVVTRLREAQEQRYITDDELRHCRDLAESVERQLGGFIKYLFESDFKDRGRFGMKNRPPNDRTEDQGSEDQGSKD